MKKYRMTESEAEEGICWKFALACILGLSPKKVPDFVGKYKDDYVAETRIWLKEKHNKSLVFIPANQFMETGKIRYNPPIGPEGYSIMVAITKSDSVNHVVIAKDGGVYHDPTPLDCDEFDGVFGYFVMYNL